jgi:DNA-binding CsgD family transcriptional regulator
MVSTLLEEREGSFDRTESPEAREAVHDALVRIDAARSEGANTGHSAKLWRGLVRGHWPTVEQFERNARRYYLVVRNDAEASGGHELTLREREVLSYAESGCSNKVIAYSLGLSPSTVSTLLSRALKRSHACFHCGPAEPAQPRSGFATPSRVASTPRAPYLGVVGSLRIPRDPLAKARITRISDRLVLVSVPLETTLDASAASDLTAAEKDVVELTLSGLSNAAVASKRRCSARTVANQLAIAYKKLGVGSRRELRARFGR